MEGNNTVSFAITGGGRGEAGYTLTHDSAAVRKAPFFAPFSWNQTDHFAKTGSGHTSGNANQRGVFPQGGDGKRWKLPAPFEPHSTINGTSKPGVDLLACERLCDQDQHQQGPQQQQQQQQQRCKGARTVLPFFAIDA